MKVVKYKPAAKHSVYSMNGNSKVKQNNLLKKQASTKKKNFITVFTITNFIILTVGSLLSKLKYPVCSFW